MRLQTTHGKNDSRPPEPKAAGSTPASRAVVTGRRLSENLSESRRRSGKNGAAVRDLPVVFGDDGQVQTKPDHIHDPVLPTKVARQWLGYCFGCRKIVEVTQPGFAS